ncbi:hypothetical protein LPJ59_001371 [Coemansia sp. RSA 2399]|nr:hypothetical protein LPJ59_001371 [Coemansia sp. RSA 2399]
MSWTNSMSSSVTVADNRALATHQHGGGSLVRQRHRLSNQTNAESIHQLILGINASRIAEESPVPAAQHIAHFNRPRNTETTQHQHGEVSLAQARIDNGSESRTRISRATHVIRRKTRRLFRMIKHYIERFMDNYSASFASHRPYQFALYY